MTYTLPTDKPVADTLRHPLIEFEPVTRRARHDGWTSATQRCFILGLSESACVAEAARKAGMSPSSAYALRRRADAGAFREAWQTALTYATHRLAEAAFARALNGVASPIFYRGEKIGERVRHDERLTQFLLRHLDTRFGQFPLGTEFSCDLEPGNNLADALNRLHSSFPVEGDLSGATAEVHISKGDVV